MEKKKSRKVGIAVCVAVIVTGIVALVLYLGGFGMHISKLFEKEQTSSEETTVQLQDVFVSRAEGPADGMSAVRLEKGTDFSDIQKAYDAVADIAEWGFNTVIFSECDLSEAAQLATHAKNSGLFSVYLIDSDAIVKSGVADKNAAASFGGVGVDSILIKAADGATQNEVALAARTLREIDESLYIGVFASAAKSYSAVCQADVFDYKYIDITVPTSTVAGEYAVFLSNYCDGTTEDTVFGMHTELVGNAEGYKKPDEIMKQFEAVTQTVGSGYAFYRYDILAKNANSLRDAITDYMKNGIMKDYFKQLIMSSPKKTVFETNQSKVSFVGTGDISKPLTVNGQVVQLVEDGYFSLEIQLKPGENIFVFDHCGKQYTYKITYKVKLIDSVSPSGAVNAPGGARLDVAVVAHKSATVTATLSGNSIKLTKSEDYGEDIDAGSDYTYFIGYYTLPESAAADRNLGKIKVTASYSGITESKEGASVTVNAKVILPPVTVPVTTTLPTATVTETAVTTIPGTSSDTTEDESSVTSTAPVTQPPTQAPTTKPSAVQLFKQLVSVSRGIAVALGYRVARHEYLHSVCVKSVHSVLSSFRALFCLMCKVYHTFGGSSRIWGILCTANGGGFMK